MNILVIGGAGYIGSHTVIELQNAVHEVVAIQKCTKGIESGLCYRD